MSKQQILWVDDEIEVLKSHIIFLSNKGYEITTLNNGAEAIDLVKKQYFDLVFLDENMPGMGGLEVLKCIKEIKNDLPIVMITKSEEEGVMEDAIGRQIEDYLIKPVNPNQILLCIKKILDNKRLINDMTALNYQQEFREIGMKVDEKLNLEEWKQLYKKLTFWELQFDKSKETGMNDIFETQKKDANRNFTKFIESNYLDFIPYDKVNAPIMSHSLMRRGILPEMEPNKPLFFILIDNLRWDQWKVISEPISELFKISKEDLYLANLPTTTQYCRNSIFSGLHPMDIEKRFGNKWSNDEDEGGKNLYEEDFLIDLIQNRLKKPLKIKYKKITNLNSGKELVDEIHQFHQFDLSVIVYNFVDTLSHARTDFKVMRELAEYEPGYRSLTLSWFLHSPLWETMKKIAEKKGKIVISTDHGSIRVFDPVKVVGDKNTTTNLRYKTGKNLTYNPKEVFEIKKPELGMLPKTHISSSFIFAKNNDYLVYPNNLNHFANYYNDTFQHGGISLEEMLIPLVTLESK